MPSSPDAHLILLCEKFIRLEVPNPPAAIQ